MSTIEKEEEELNKIRISNNKYEFLCSTNPKATILNEASVQNITKKYCSVASFNFIKRKKRKVLINLTFKIS